MARKWGAPTVAARVSEVFFRFGRGLGLSGLGLAMLAATPTARAADVDPRCAVYLRTETHANRGVGVWAEATLEAPPERVFEILTDFERYPQYVPRVLRSEKRPNDRVFTELKAPWPLRNIWFITHIEKGRQGNGFILRWSMERGNIAVNQGSWTVSRIAAGGSRLRYQGTIELHSVMPPALLKLAEEYELPHIMQAIRKRVVDSLGGDASRNLRCTETVMQRM